MNQYIEFSRLILVIKKFWFEHWKALVLLYLAIAAMLTIWMSVYFFFGPPRLFRENFQVSYYSLGLLLSGCLTASFLFGELKSRPQAIQFLLLPVSSCEKILCNLFFGVLVFWIGYMGVFYVVDYMFVTLSNIKNGTHWAIINLFKVGEYEDSLIDQIPSPYSFYFAFQALFILGSLYFKRYSFFKTALIVLFIWIALLIIPMVVIGSVGPGVPVDSLNSLEVFDVRGNKLLEMPTWFKFTTALFFGYGITGILWLATYFRLTEKQVN